MALRPEDLDRLWDFSDPAGTLARLDDAVAAAPSPALFLRVDALHCSR